MSSLLSRQYFPEPVAAVLDRWLPGIREILGDGLTGASICGSVALGEFEPGWSDVDFCVQVRDPVTDRQAREIGALHDRIEAWLLSEEHPSWQSGQALEGAYVPEALADRPGDAARCLVVGTGTRSIEECDPVPGLDRYLLANHALPIVGEPRPFRAPTREALTRAQAWLPERLSKPATEHSSIMLAGLMQEAARTIVFFRDGELLGKSTALAREIGAGSPFADAYRLALGIRREGSRTAESRRGELLETYDAVAGPVRSVLLGLLRWRP
jgi:hypothetical protein